MLIDLYFVFVRLQTLQRRQLLGEKIPAQGLRIANEMKRVYTSCINAFYFVGYSQPLRWQPSGCISQIYCNQATSLAAVAFRQACEVRMTGCFYSPKCVVQRRQDS
jgi:hypothetical protein